MNTIKPGPAAGAGAHADGSAPRWHRDPPGFPSEVEDVQPIRDEPLWTESFHGSGYDSARRIGFFAHVARAQFDPRLWDETCVVYLPDGRFLVCRDFGYGDTPAGPAANVLSYRHTAPFETWEIRFQGAARLVTAAELASSALTDDEYVAAKLTLDLRAAGPVFGIGGMNDEFWAHFHSEQHLEITGELCYRGDRLEFAGTGLRDHSVGPRDVSHLDRHTWCHGEFPSGRVFMVMDVDAGDGTRLNYAVTGDGDGLWDATITQPGASLLESSKEHGESYTVELGTLEGPTVIEAEILSSLPLSLRGANSWVLGSRPDAHHLMYECQTRFTWNGEVGYGLTERSVRI